MVCAGCAEILRGTMGPDRKQGKGCDKMGDREAAARLHEENKELIAKNRMRLTTNRALLDYNDRLLRHWWYRLSGRLKKAQAELIRANNTLRVANKRLEESDAKLVRMYGLEEEG